MEEKEKIPDDNNMFKNYDLMENEANTKNKKLTFIAMIILFLIIITILIILFFITKDENNKDKIDNETNISPIPKNEDLNFTEENHRLFSREVATQTMVLATNNGGLPLQPTDQVTLFGSGTINTIYGGWGSGEVYEKGEETNISPVQILEGIENITDRFIYIKNEIGYEIGIPGIKDNKNLTEEDIQNFSVKREGAKRSVAILTISRRSGEEIDRPQDQSNSGTLLSNSEKDTYNSLIKYFDKVVVILNVGSVMELEGIETDKKTSTEFNHL